MTLPIGTTRANNASGFTLVEMLLVLIITGIIVAMAAPSFSQGYAQFQLKETSDDLLSLSRWAQAMAVGQERVYALSFSQDQHSYGLVRGEVDENDNAQTNFVPVPGKLGRPHVIPGGVSLNTEVDKIEFYPDGTIDPATITLTGYNKKMVLSSAVMRGMLTVSNNE